MMAPVPVADKPTRDHDGRCDCDVVWRSTYVSMCQRRDDLVAALRDIRNWSDIGDDPAPSRQSLREIDAIALAAITKAQS